VPRPGQPYRPEDPYDEHAQIVHLRAEQLRPLVDLSGGVQFADREGVFAQSFRCRACTLHFVLFSWSRTRHTPDTIACPECGHRGGFLHYTTEVSRSVRFRVDDGRDPEIYDVWPYRSRQA
jgi:DNA-directed RNA polymerase subunit RPC12/RpoP